MPFAPKRPCTFPGGCSKLVSSGRCDAHKAVQQRGKTAERGYGYAWVKLRRWFLQQPENVVCNDCRREIATEVHHRRKISQYPDERLDPGNLVGLCGTCHRMRTARGE